MHLLSAKNSECEYFLTFDSDFIRAREEIKQIFGITILHSIKEIYETI